MSLLDNIKTSAKEDSLLVSQSNSALLDSLAHQFDGTDFESRAQSNPYLTSSYGSKTLWDKIGDLIGFRTSEDVYETDRIQAAKDYNAQLQQLYDEQAYNSPSAQASRYREAGINPDINGSVSSGEASEFSQEQTSPVSPPASYNFGQFSKVCFDAIQVALNLADGFTSLRGKFIDQAGAELSQYSAVDSVALLDFLSQEQISDSDFDDYPNMIAPAVKVEKGPDKFSSKRLQSAYDRKLSQLIRSGSLRGQGIRMQGLNQYYGDRLSMFESKNAYGLDGLDSSLDIITRHLGSLRKATEEATLKASAAQGKFDEAYTQGLDPSQVSESDMASYKSSEQEKEISEALNKTVNGIVSDLRKNIDDDPKHAFFSRLLLIGFYLLSNNLMPSLSFGRSSSQGAYTGKFGSSARSSSGFNFGIK
ncbi:minor capsid protein [Capybara microvirus Cap1_SP_83]|nr:minor capsid protein [Capybara microvirus Cap1_SP_83]